jgi:Ca2+-binding EF-hand superfamily protein
MRVRVLVAIALQLALPAGADAQSRQPAPPDPAIQLSRLITPGMRLTAFLDQVRPMFRVADANGDGVISAEDIALAAAQAATGMRAAAVAEFLRYDSNGDGVVTREEIAEHEMRNLRTKGSLGGTAPNEEAMKKAVEAAVARRMQADLDGDGRIEFAEMLAYARRAAAPPSPLEPAQRLILAMDKDGDGRTTLDEFNAAAREVFRAVDSDGDETVSKEELDAYRLRTGQVAASPARPLPDARRQQEEEEQAPERLACAMPKASDRAVVVLLSAYEADALSTTTIGSQDVAVGTGTITVQPGAEPIYLVVASFRPTIWRFSGAVERIERVVLAGNNTAPNAGLKGQVPLVGATGIAAERLTLLSRPGCVSYFTDAPSTKSATAAGLVRRESGREPSVVSGHYEVAGFSVPSGEVASRRDDRNRSRLVIIKESGTLRLEGDTSGIVVRRPSESLVSELNRFSPGGVVEIDPKTVVASKPAEPYEVLPQQAGLIQLVQSGALTQNRSGEFLIQRKIRFPAELHGAHSVKFLLLRGVPEPEGDPGHSKVISEETGLELKKAGK